MILAFDTETTGFTVKHLPSTAAEQPNLVQLAALLIDPASWRTMQSVNLIIKPDLDAAGKPKWVVPDQAARVHGITTDIAMMYGVPLRTAVSCFTNLRRVSKATLAHNLEYDRIVMQAAIHRCGGDASLLEFPVVNYCTMRLGEPICKLPATVRMVNAGMADKFKAPNLQELHQFFFGAGFEGAHDALADIDAAARCFREMVARKQVVL